MEGGELFTRIQERADTAFTERGLTINNYCTKQFIVELGCKCIFVVVRAQGACLMAADVVLMYLGS